jgi:biotin carboxylase
MPLKPFTAFKLILPARDGYWCRENIISHRFRGCETQSIKEFVSARQYCQRPRMKNITSTSIWPLLAVVVSSLQLKPSKSIARLEERFAFLQAEVLNRLSFPVLVPNPIPRQRLALLHGRPDWTITEGIYRAASELGIELYVLDEPGHWMQNGKYNWFRESFIPIDLTLDESLPLRVAQTLREYPVQMDGLVSFSDKYLVPAAQSAQLLGLPGNCPSVLETCRDKYLSRMIDPPEDFLCARFDRYDDVAGFLSKQRENGGPSYPLIVKPCSGFGSEGVAKVYNDAGLMNAAAKANPTDYGRGASITIETYIDGPEVDCNLVMWKGLPVFCEINDQLPSEADLPTATAMSNFLEVDQVMPSALVESEQELIRNSMVRLLTKLGVQNGVFHMEARMRNSSMEYRLHNDVVDLVRKPDVVRRLPTEALLIESNCRPPSIACTSSTAHTYGVDFYALHHLIALGDEARVKALTAPFLAGPQYHCDLAMIPVTAGGIYASADAIQSFEKQHPELAQHVVMSRCFFQAGEEVPDPSSGVLTWIAFFIVKSNKSRRDAIDIAMRVREKFRYDVVPSASVLHKGSVCYHSK